MLQVSYDEQDSYWPYVMAQRGRPDTLELATLIAAEAYRIEPTAKAANALRKLISSRSILRLVNMS